MGVNSLDRDCFPRSMDVDSLDIDCFPRYMDGNSLDRDCFHSSGNVAHSTFFLFVKSRRMTENSEYQNKKLNTNLLSVGKAYVPLKTTLRC